MRGQSVGYATMTILYPYLIEMLQAGQRGRATNMAIPLLGMQLGGEVVLGIIAAGAMAAMLSTSVGLLISMSTSLSHDVYAGVLRPDSSDRERLAHLSQLTGHGARKPLILLGW
jgi:cation/acetate symporter